MKSILLRVPGLILVALGGGAGFLSRVAATEGLAAYLTPWTATSLVNLFGSIAAGAIWMSLAQARQRSAMAPSARLAVMAFAVTGFLGGFTTFSGFGVDTAQLAGSGALDSAIANFWVGMVIAIIGATVGAALVRRRQAAGG